MSDELQQLSDEVTQLRSCVSHLEAGHESCLATLAALRESEERFRGVFQCSPIAIEYFDAEGRLVEVNQACVEIFGVPNADYLSAVCLFDDPNLPPGTRERLLQGETVRFSTWYDFSRIAEMGLYVSSKTEPLYLNAVMIPICNESQITGFLVQVQDVTKRKLAEEDADQEKRRVRALVDASPFGVHEYRLEPDGRLVFTGANRAAERILGFNHQPLIGNTIEEAFPQLSLTEIPDAYRHVAATGEAYEHEALLYTDDRVNGAFELHAFQTSVHQMAVFFRDVTERKQAEKVLRRSELTIREIFNAVNDGILILDIETGEFLQCNDAAVTLFGFPNVESLCGVTPQQVSEGVPPYDIAHALQAIRRAIEKGPQVLEWLSRRADGSLFWTEIGLRSAHIDGKERALAVIRDIDDRKRVHDSLLKLQARKLVMQETLLQLAQLSLDEHEKTVRVILEADAAAMQVAQVGVWWIDPDCTELNCEDLYVAATGEHQSGARLMMHHEHPYFEHLLSCHAIVADECQTDPVTEIFADTYLRPCGITSLLDVPIRRQGKVVGVLCHEHMGQIRNWTDEEVAFGVAVAERIALELERTERRRVTMALRQSEERLRLAFEAANDGLWDWNVKTDEIYWHPRCFTMLGFEPNAFEVKKESVIALIHPEKQDEVRARLHALLDGSSELYEVEYRMRTKDDDWRWILSRAKVFEQDAEGNVLRVLGTHTDITDRSRTEAWLQYLAYYDHLTDLPNRTLFQNRFSIALTHLKRHDGAVGVMLLDIDHFKEVNDVYGHLIGDALLKQVAHRLSACIRECDTLARLSGDEFALLITDVDTPEVLDHVLRRLLAAFDEPFILDDTLEVVVTASIGVALAPHDGMETDVLMKYADIAMYQAKAAGRNAYRLFSREMAQRIASRKELEKYLLKSIEYNELEVFYQPQINVQSQRLRGIEALVRWRHPLLGMISPADFIPLAEEIGFIEEIDHWVMRTACRQMRTWWEAYGSDFLLAVNLSARQFQRPDLCDLIADVLKETDLPPQMLEVEITEGVAMKDWQLTQRVIHQLRDLGVRVAIDDFGTGHCSLGYLKYFPIDTIKIAQTFVRDLTADSRDVSIVRSMIDMAHALGNEVIAEGVETAEQLTVVSSHSGDIVQGYLFSRPMPVDECHRYLQSMHAVV